MKQRNKNGTYKYKPFKKSKWGGLILLLTTMTLGAYIDARYTPVELHNPLGTVQVHAQAPEPVVELIVEPHTLTIEEKIIEVFGKDADDALKIARCESQRDGKIQPNLIGDTHLMVENSGEIVGDSIGVFQVRTGGAGWNRAKANGMTADEFRTKLKDYHYNIEYAKDIFDNAKGWTPWLNCMRKVL